MKYLSIVLILTAVTACSPQMHFLGDNYPATTHVDTYYSIDDISKNFKVIGQLTGTNENTSVAQNLEEIKNHMVEEAKKRGAHGILFLFSDSYGYEHRVRADLIRYVE